MNVIILEKVYDKKGTFLGDILIEEADITLEFIEKLKGDKDDKMGWKKYKKVLNDAGYTF